MRTYRIQKEGKVLHIEASSEEQAIDIGVTLNYDDFKDGQVVKHVPKNIKQCQN